MSDPIRIGGFFSSFDTESVIAQLTAARQRVITRMDIQEATATARKASIASIQAKFAALLAKTNAVLGQNSVTGKSTSLTGEGILASASPTAPLGTFTVDVTKLASATKATGTPLTAALDAASPLNLSNFGTTPGSGSYTISTATGGLQQFTVGATTALPATLLNASNFSVAPTDGTFTITTATGGAATLTVNTATQTLQDVVNAINGTAIGVTASITNDANGRANILSITSTQGAITFGAGGDTSNFLTATNLTASTGTTTRASLNPFTKMMSLNQVIGEINASGIGVTATVTNDAYAKANILTLTSTQGAIGLGNAGDTSNFLSATNLLASPAGATRASTQAIARLNISAKMNVASFNGGSPAAGDHTFTINGTSISYNTASDSLLDVISRINASAAGVSFRYDTQTDTVKMQQVKTGSMAVTLADDGAGGNLLSKLGLLAATQTLGDNAEYKIDGGATQYAATNTVTHNGVSLTLNAITTPGTPPSVTVAQDSSSALSVVKAFVSEFNSVLAAIDQATLADGAAGKKSGPMSGDASLRQLKSSLREIITSAGVNVGGRFTTLGQIGMSFGAVGSALGTTNTLQLDETRFKDALVSDPASVQAVLSSLTLTPALAPGGTGSIAGFTGAYAGGTAGTYTITDDGLGNLSSVFTPANGGSTTTMTSKVLAGGTDTTLIPGLTLTINPVLTAGVNVVTVSATSQSVVQRIKAFGELQSGVGGVLQKRQDSYTAVVKDLAKRKDSIQAHIDAEMAILRKKFAAMEQAQARAQGVQSALTQAIARMNPSKE
ncbi:MAG: hypothetical protein C0506_12425 [Anaerolinea sp.]|nr:hypothetical protein [Anaerolinea sp.]